MLPAGTSRLLCLLSVLLCVCASRGQQCNDKDGFYARHGIGLEELNGEFSKMSRDAYRLTSLSAYADVDQPRYAATWVKTSAAAAKQQILPKLTLAELNAQLASTTAFCIKSITGYTFAGTDFYAAVWDAPASGGSCPEVDVRPAMTRDAYLQQFGSWQSTHYPTWINRYADGAKIAAIYTRNGAGMGPTDWETRDNQDFATFAANNQQLTDRGYRLMVVSGFRAGFDGYAAIWWRGDGFRADRAWEVHVGLSAENYQCKFDNLMYSGFVPLYVNANSGGTPAMYQAIFELQGLKAADMAAIDKIVADYTLATPLPSLSVALAKGARIRFARSWGYADKNNGRFACPTSAYRVASVSKPITSTGIFKLVQQGKLALNNKVFGEGALLGTKYGTLPYKQYVQDITVQHLLEHTAGGEAWTNNDKDPMFDPDHINLSQAELIKWVLDTRTIAKPPGTDFFYSNFGYMLLARVIEEVTQQGYEDWIRAYVLKAQSAEGMFIAGSALADRRPNEVVYEDSFDPYAINAHRMDGHGGWAGSALDALRFTLGVDGMRAVGGEVLASAQYNAMLTPVAVNNKYARGWAVRATGGTDHWHTGRMPGTNTEIAVLFDSDISHAILTNTRTPNDSVLELIHAIRKAITVWPCSGWDAGASGFAIPRINQQPVEIVRRPTECPECGFRDAIVRPDLLAPVASTSLLSQNQPALTSFDG